MASIADDVDEAYPRFIVRDGDREIPLFDLIKMWRNSLGVPPDSPISVTISDKITGTSVIVNPAGLQNVEQDMTAPTKKDSGNHLTIPVPDTHQPVLPPSVIRELILSRGRPFRRLSHNESLNQEDETESRSENHRRRSTSESSYSPVSTVDNVFDELPADILELTPPCPEVVTSGSQLSNLFIIHASQIMTSIGSLMHGSRSVGTGSRIAAGLILTARHVFKELEGKDNVFIRFHDYGKPIPGSSFGVEQRVLDVPLHANSFYESSWLDYAIMTIKEPPESEKEEHEKKLKSVEILTWVLPTDREKLENEHINIFSYFKASHQQVSLRKNLSFTKVPNESKIINVKDPIENDRFLLYEADTSEGSSGAPLFNDEWQLVGLRVEGGTCRNSKTKKQFPVNYGILIKYVLHDMYVTVSGKDTVFEESLNKAAKKGLGVPFKTAREELKAKKKKKRTPFPNLEFAQIEAVITAFTDEFPVFKGKWRKPLFVVGLCVSMLILGIPCVMQGGMWVFNLMDYQTAGISLLFLVLCEVITVSWIYGLDNFSRDVEAMTGKKPNRWFRICWKYTTPVVTIIIVLANVFQWAGVSYNKIAYPGWVEFIGWVMALSSMLLIPGVALYEMWKTPGTFMERYRTLTTPDREMMEKIKQENDIVRSANVILL